MEPVSRREAAGLALEGPGPGRGATSTGKGKGASSPEETGPADTATLVP